MNKIFFYDTLTPHIFIANQHNNKSSKQCNRRGREEQGLG
jgi:hypothetical protein